MTRISAKITENDGNFHIFQDKVYRTPGTSIFPLPAIITTHCGISNYDSAGQDEDEAVRHLWGKLAILLQRGNAAILGNCVPDFPAPAIDGRH